MRHSWWLAHHGDEAELPGEMSSCSRASFRLIFPDSVAIFFLSLPLQKSVHLKTINTYAMRTLQHYRAHVFHTRIHFDCPEPLCGKTSSFVNELKQVVWLQGGRELNVLLYFLDSAVECWLHGLNNCMVFVQQPYSRSSTRSLVTSCQHRESEM